MSEPTQAREKRWDVEFCDHCGYGRHENWRCEHGMCSDGPDGGNVEPSFSLVEVMPVSEHEEKLKRVEEEIRERFESQQVRDAATAAVASEQSREGPGCGCDQCIAISALRAAVLAALPPSQSSNPAEVPDEDTKPGDPDGSSPGGHRASAGEEDPCHGLREDEGTPEGHRVEIEFDGAATFTKLLHPQNGCEPPIDPDTGETCGEDCWLTDWVEEHGVDLIFGKVVLAVDADWDGDSVRLYVRDDDPRAAVSKASPPGLREEEETAEPRPIMPLLRAGNRVRGGIHTWLRGAPSHVLAELLTELEAEGWELKQAPPVDRDGEG